ncbi:glycosyltransferase family 2 protein [Cellulomonas sp. DKR-3]|uniref:4,4'-diaponeurosporenoate glycosyltransferase n=1 Tax=Cellulomonas fulva TaxID=2835530 RepID=A0ABS5U2D2_9CELL|nr:glycosyltransferase family 2 protein [Cellulomonas fulva]MBT0995558.1 glycosyltransferase family 2 protein [Cellulomonas fulva]
MTPRALPTVSVVVPALDDAPALARCLQALAGQTVAPLEVVVVDNGSSDATAAVARAAGARVVDEPRRGIPAAAAAGYDAAVGDVIGRLDADSVPAPDWVERVATTFARDPRCAAVTGTGRFVDLPAVVGPAAMTVYLGAYYVLGGLAVGGTTLWGSSMALRRGAWREVRRDVTRSDAEVHDDLDLAFALGPRRRVRLERGLRVGVSARSLRGGSQLARRFARAGRTLRRNWRRQPPWTRWRVRLSG